MAGFGEYLRNEVVYYNLWYQTMRKSYSETLFLAAAMRLDEEEEEDQQEEEDIDNFVPF